MYNQNYESAGKFWPDVHRRVVTALIVSQLLLTGLLSTKQASKSTPFLLVLPVLTIGFHMHCKCRYQPAFVRYSLQASKKKTLNILRYVVALSDIFLHFVVSGSHDQRYTGTHT